jgi:hypothetical protein
MSESRQPSPDEGRRAGERDRVAAVVRGQLEERGIDVSDADDGEPLIELLEAVEDFETVVESLGADSYTNAPDSSRPEAPNLVLPRRGADESVREYASRVGRAADRLRATRK